MTFDEYEKKMNALRTLVEKASTGSPKDLAELFTVSERTIRRMVQNLKQQELDIEFCRKRNSYLFKKVN
jgi:DeoR/GlpR family transcriptional regulator of sugar metabolism